MVTLNDVQATELLAALFPFESLTDDQLEVVGLVLNDLLRCEPYQWVPAPERLAIQYALVMARHQGVVSSWPEDAAEVAIVHVDVL